MTAYELSLATDGETLLAGWHGGYEAPDSIFLQLLTPAGKTRGAPVRITTGPHHAYEPDLLLMDGDVIVAWYEKDMRTSALSAWVGRFSIEGQKRWRQRLGERHRVTRNPVVRAVDDALAVAWIEQDADAVSQEAEVWSVQMSPDGEFLGDALQSGAASRDTWNLNAAVGGDGVFHIVFDAGLGNARNELQHIAIANGDAVQTQMSSDDGFASLYPDIAIGKNGEAALTWFDERDGNREVYLRAGATIDAVIQKATESHRVSHTAAASIGAYLAFGDKDLALVWSDRDQGQGELYARIFDRTGAPASNIRRLTHTAEQSSIPAIRRFGTGWAVVWNEYVSLSEVGHGSVVSSTAHSTLLQSQFKQPDR